MYTRTPHTYLHTHHTLTRPSRIHTHTQRRTHTQTLPGQSSPGRSGGVRRGGCTRQKEEGAVAKPRNARHGLTRPGPGPTSCGEGLLTSAGPGSHMPGAQRVFVGGPRTGSGGPGSVPCPLPHQDPVPWVRTLLPCHPDPPVVGTALPSLDLRRTALEQTAPGWGSGPGPPGPPGPLRRRQPLPREEPQELVPIRKASLGTGAPGTHRA